MAVRSYLLQSGGVGLLVSSRRQRIIDVESLASSLQSAHRAAGQSGQIEDAPDLILTAGEVRVSAVGRAVKGDVEDTIGVPFP